MTILKDTLNGKVREEIIRLANLENIDRNKLMKRIIKGHAIIMTRPNCDPIGIGSVFTTKINVNLGTSDSKVDINEELEKVKIAQKYGAHTISDLSMGGDIDFIRKKILQESLLPVTTVPIYQVVAEASSTINISEDQILSTIQKQINDGISSIVLHAAVNLNDLHKLKGKRIMGMVSKGGTFTASIMVENSIENPFMKNFDYILEMVKEKDIVINLGNSMRSGCIHDKLDDLQISELKINSTLAKRANKQGIQIIIEGLGGHVNARDLSKWIRIYKKISNKRPLFVAGPLPTEIGVGHDHIAAAIGGALASGYGADYLCMITPAEHLSLPSVEDIKEGLIAYKIAAHVGDSIKFGLNRSFDKDLNLSRQRFLKNWQKSFEYSIDPEEAQKRHPIDENTCTMCGKFCALSISKRILNLDKTQETERIS
ncbi:MAG: phosphomethylpyrimidine synthase ThiC [Candidatus Lokiarchaeota archaeon]|nr:phosphomethylpyrimidine synthase ThiC [Candidatus Lokiarchaeota archaeon]